MIYATSDIHGYPLDAFRQLLDSAGFSDSDTLYVLGDVIDRNGDGGINMLLWMMNQPNIEMILGNHEAMLLSCTFLFEEITDRNIDCLNTQRIQLLNQWMINGAQPTLSALRMLKNREPSALNDLLDYLRDVPLYAAVSAGDNGFLLVHSGFGNYSPDKKLSQYTPDELLWYRPSEQDFFYPEFITILGHTPTGNRFGEKGKMFRTQTWIDIDTGAARGGSPMLLRLDDLKAFYVEENIS